MAHKQRGNAFLITLVSVMLFGALTFVVVRQMNGSAVQNISNEKADIYANEIIAHAEEMKAVLQQMQMLNVPVESLDFTKPSSGSFNSGDTLKKVFHPSGGGLRQMEDFVNGSTLTSDIYDPGYSALNDTVLTGWQVQYGYNVEWTPTAATDILYSFLGLSRQICQRINFKLTGSTTIPTVTLSGSGPFNTFFSRGGADGDFTSAGCSACVGRPMLCVNGNGTMTNYAFYSVVLAR